MSDKKYINTNVGSVLRAPADTKNPDAPARFYMKFERRKDKNKQYVGESPFPLVINEGDVLNMYSSAVGRERAVKEGKLTQEQADKLDFIKYDIVKSEEAGAVQQAAPAKSNGKGKSDIDF